MYLKSTAECQAPPYECGWIQECKTYNDAVLAATKHNRETGHAVRAEQIRTVLIGYENESPTDH